MPIAFTKGQGFRLTTTSLSRRGNVLTKKSVVSFTFDPGEFTPEVARRLAQDAATHGGKLGFRIDRRQKIEGVQVAGMKLGEDARLSRELAAALGAGPREKWVGFRLPGGPELLMGEFKTTLRVRFASRRAGAFQLVPVVVAFGNQDVRKHHLLGVSVLKAGPPFVHTFVEVDPGR